MGDWSNLFLIKAFFNLQCFFVYFSVIKFLPISTDLVDLIFDSDMQFEEGVVFFEINVQNYNWNLPEIFKLL